jgi:hypothetical protein
MLWPFKKKEAQKISSIIAIGIGVIWMALFPTINTGEQILNTFVIGAVFAFIGLVYFFDTL